MPPWSTLPITGSWMSSDGSLRPGTYGIYSNAVVRSDAANAVIMPKGLVHAGELNIDETKLGGESLRWDSPMVDDPDIFPAGWELRININPLNAERSVYRVQPKLEDQLVGGIDLDLVLPWQQLPLPDPDIVLGSPGGLARLNSAGQVINAFGVPVGAGSGDLGLTHVQSVPASEWSISHGFGRYPKVTITDSFNREVETDVEYPDLSTVIIIWAVPTTGKATLS